MLRMIDSFDHYATADLTLKWTALTGSPTVGAFGRRSTSGFRCSGTLTQNGATKTLDSQATWIVGFSLNPASLPTIAAIGLVRLLDSGTLHVDVRINLAGQFVITRNGTTIAGPSTEVASFGSHQYIEFKATIHDTTGSVELKVNGATILTATNIDTRNGANSTANQIMIGHVTGGAGPGAGNMDYDDVYICDATGGANDDFLGDVRVDCFLPNANGNSSDLVGSDSNSVDNYLLVDETDPDDDTTYVQSDVVGDHDSYGYPNLSHTPSEIFGVQVNMFAKKDDAGARSIQSVTRSNGADYNGAAQGLSTSYVIYREVLEEDPDTSAAWTESGFNAAEFGVKVAA